MTTDILWEDGNRRGVIRYSGGDTSYLDPRDYDNLGVMVANGHRRYKLGDKSKWNDSVAAFMSEPGNTFEGLIEYLKAEAGATVVLPLWLYDHGGLSMRTGRFWEDSGGWDSGLVGAIFDTTESRKMMGVFTTSVEKVLQSEVEEYDKYLRGDAWEIGLEEKVEWRRVDSDEIRIEWELVDGYTVLGHEYALQECQTWQPVGVG